MHRPHIRRYICTAALLLAACTDVPELDGAAPADLSNAPYPRLIPLDSEFRSEPPPREEGEELASAMEARRAALLRKARELQSPIVDKETEERMRRGIEE